MEVELMMMLTVVVYHFDRMYTLSLNWWNQFVFFIHARFCSWNQTVLH